MTKTKNSVKSILKNLNGQKIIVIFNKKDLRNFAECKNKWQEELIDLKIFIKEINLCFLFRKNLSFIFF